MAMPSELGVHTSPRGRVRFPGTYACLTKAAGARHHGVVSLLWFS
jgi:hypothetical protein